MQKSAPDFDEQPRKSTRKTGAASASAAVLTGLPVGVEATADPDGATDAERQNLLLAGIDVDDLPMMDPKTLAAKMEASTQMSFNNDISELDVDANDCECKRCGALPIDEELAMKTDNQFVWQQWRVDIVNARSKLGIPVTNFTPWTRPGPGGARAAENFFLDYSQSATRTPWGPRVTLCSSTHVYSFEHDMTLTGKELMMVMGIPIAEMEDRRGEMFDNTDMHFRAAEGFFGASIGSIMAAVVLNPDASW